MAFTSLAMFMAHDPSSVQMDFFRLCVTRATRVTDRLCPCTQSPPPWAGATKYLLCFQTVNREFTNSQWEETVHLWSLTGGIAGKFPRRAPQVTGWCEAKVRVLKVACHPGMQRKGQNYRLTSSRLGEGTAFRVILTCVYCSVWERSFLPKKSGQHGMDRIHKKCQGLTSGRDGDVGRHAMPPPTRKGQQQI